MKICDLVNHARNINLEKIENFKDENKKIKIGIMGGTFDPIHYAHLATAEFIRDKFDLDKILFIPSGNPPHKGNVANKFERYNMVLLATSTNKYFITSDIEIKREKKTYTIDTLNKLKKIYKDCELFFITGADAICDIESWSNVKENFKLATFIAATRPGISLIFAQEKIERLKEKYNAKIKNVYVPSIDISSTYLREQIKANKTIKYLVPDNVISYIEENKLYKNGVE